MRDILKAGLLILLFVAFVLAIVFAVGWISRGTDIVSADNVAEQHYQIIEDYNALKAAAANACAVGDPETSDKSPVLVESPALAYEATFRNIAADYNRRQANLFEAKLVGPGGYPKSIEIPAGEVDWCEISRDL